MFRRMHGMRHSQEGMSFLHGKAEKPYRTATAAGVHGLVTRRSNRIALNIIPVECVVGELGRTYATKEINVKNILKLATIGAALAVTVTAASAQSTGRNAYDQPARNWNSGLMAGPSYYGYGNGAGHWNDPTNYRSGESNTNFWATPGSQEERDIGGSGG